jgi:hypothetical protein
LPWANVSERPRTLCSQDPRCANLHGTKTVGTGRDVRAVECGGLELAGCVNWYRRVLIRPA